MDIRTKRNDYCIIGLPRCDYIFNSSRSCFIAYGFNQSDREKDIIEYILKDFNIESVEAGASISSGQLAFCTKICSKIIQSQFCVILINNDEKLGEEIPNANVNMEYGLMLGFNKYIVPFQKSEQKLPFNVAGLDTIKYDNRNFKTLAINAIQEAIEKTTPKFSESIPSNQQLETFLLSKNVLISPLIEDGDKKLFALGNPLEFLFLNNFEGDRVLYLGYFTKLRPEAIAWRVIKISEILSKRMSDDTLLLKCDIGLVRKEYIGILKKLLSQTEIWIVVTGNDARDQLLKLLKDISSPYKIVVYTENDITNEVSTINNISCTDLRP